MGCKQDIVWTNSPYFQICQYFTIIYITYTLTRFLCCSQNCTDAHYHPLRCKICVVMNAILMLFYDVFPVPA